VVYNAHQHGMVSVLWIYPLDTAVKDEKDPHLITGATGVGTCLGTDFMKVIVFIKYQQPHSNFLFVGFTFQIRNCNLFLKYISYRFVDSQFYSCLLVSSFIICSSQQ
jgi:hypothetical protein